MADLREVRELLQIRLNQPRFRDYCEKIRSMSRFDDMFEIMEKVSAIQIDNIDIDESKMYMDKPFTPDELKHFVFSFYKHLDDLDPAGPNLTEKVKYNEKYMIFDKEKRNIRSSCGYRTLEDGTTEKWIHTHIERSVRDPNVAAHEVCHSLNKKFEKMIPLADSRMDEIPSIIVDALSSEFMREAYPELAEGVEEAQKDDFIVSVIKARECLLEALIVKMGVGEIGMDEAFEKYEHIFKKTPGVVHRKFNELRQEGRFENPFYEYRYIVPQAIAQEMRERYKKDPQRASSELKTIIEHAHDWTQEDTLNYLGLPKQEKLLDRYADKFQERVKVIRK